jgi:hypothetical protein
MGLVCFAPSKVVTCSLFTPSLVSPLLGIQ